MDMLSRQREGEGGGDGAGRESVGIAHMHGYVWMVLSPPTVLIRKKEREREEFCNSLEGFSA